MWKWVGLCALLFAGCASLVPADPAEAKKKLAVDLGLELTEVHAVRPCAFATTPIYVRRAEFVECALVQTNQGFVVARAVKEQARFESAVVLPFPGVQGYNLRIWGLAAQLQFVTASGVVSVHLKSGGRDSMDQQEEARKVASVLREKGVREIESPGRVDPAVNSLIPVLIPVR
jgi:hypothetical protein